MDQSIPRAELNACVKTINSNSLLNKQLQRICSENGLKTTGVKADLQRRIVEAISQADLPTFRELEHSIWAVRNSAVAAPPRAQPGYYSSSPNTTPAPSGPHTMTNFNNYQQSYNIPYPVGSGSGQRGLPMASQALYFQESPFYRILTRLGDVRVCEAMTNHRNSVNIQIKGSDSQYLTECTRDPSMRVMLFCATDNHGVQEIAFPHQSELKVNGGEIKANLRGLKNKPGSTRPVDVTDHLRLKIPGYTNNVEFTYALTTKAGATKIQKYYLVVHICKAVPVEQLVRNITKKISKASVILEMTKKANDAEIEMSSQVLSLKCPLSYGRLNIPCRSTSCTHIQCFDATSYLQLQEQGPQWLCPVCSNPAPYDRLAVDEYVKDILSKTAKSVDQVEIEPNAQWKVHGEQEEKKSEPQYETYSLDDDDDDFIISDPSYRGTRSTLTPSTSAPIIGTPATNPSRESSMMPAPRSTAKRSHAQVIDLTGSDDDDEPPRPAKKQQYANNYLSGYPAY